MSLALLVTISHAMMGPKQDRQGKLFYTSFNLDDRIRPDKPLHKTHQLLDFSWIRPATAASIRVLVSGWLIGRLFLSSK